MNVHQDSNNWTHIDWELESVTANMIDWFWNNMEKGFFLWHPIEHNDFYWKIPPKVGAALGAIHVAPQTWSDGTQIKPHIRFDDVATLPANIKEVIKYEHVVIAVGICLFEKDYAPDNKPVAYRIHQWEKTDSGVRGMSSAIPVTDDPLETQRGLVWAKHAGEEVGYWADFLPQLYTLYRPVVSPEVNLFNSFAVTGQGETLRYVEAAHV